MCFNSIFSSSGMFVVLNLHIQLTPLDRATLDQGLLDPIKRRNLLNEYVTGQTVILSGYSD